MQLTFDEMLKKLNFVMLSEELLHLTRAHIKFYSLSWMILILSFTNVGKIKLCHALMYLFVIINSPDSFRWPWFVSSIKRAKHHPQFHPPQHITVLHDVISVENPQKAKNFSKKKKSECPAQLTRSFVAGFNQTTLLQKRNSVSILEKSFLPFLCNVWTSVLENG